MVEKADELPTMITKKKKISRRDDRNTDDIVYIILRDGRKLQFNSPRHLHLPTRIDYQWPNRKRSKYPERRNKLKRKVNSLNTGRKKTSSNSNTSLIASLLSTGWLLLLID